MPMTMMLMQNYRNNICDLNELGVYNVDEDNKTQGYGKYRRKTIVMAMTDDKARLQKQV